MFQNFVFPSHHSTAPNAMSDPLHHSPKPPLPPFQPSVSADVPLSTAPPPSTPSSDTKKPEPDAITVPTYSSWFTWNGIHEVEYKNNPEFFTGKSTSKTPKLYKYYRNAIVKKSRANPGKKLTFTELRRTIVGDVGSIRRVFDFLETWGLINYSPPSGKQPFKWEDKEAKTNSAAAAANAPGNAAIGGGGGVVEGGANAAAKARKLCSGCRTICTIACFVCDEHGLVLCARCYVRGNYRVGLTSEEFRRVEISEPAKSEWTDRETVQLMEAVMHYGDDWKRVAENVAGRSEKDCVARFIKLPFGEQFVEPAEFTEEESLSCELKDQNDTESGAEPVAKKMRLTPLADASNPIMAQAAFLSALAGVEVSEAAAEAAVATLYNTGHLTDLGNSQSQAHLAKDLGPGVVSGESPSVHASEEAHIVAEAQLTQEEDAFLNSISAITVVKIKDIADKIGRFEEMDLQLEREWTQFDQMKQQLFLDKLTLLFHKTATSSPAERVSSEQN